MDCIAVAGNHPRPRIAAMQFGNGLLLRHPGRNSEVDCVTPRMRTVPRFGQPLRPKRVLVRLRAKTAGGNQTQPANFADRVEVSAESRPALETPDLLARQAPNCSDRSGFHP